MSADPNETLRIRLGYRDVDTFVERFAPNVTLGGVFLASRTPLPVGETFRFEISLAGGPMVLSGEGKVTWIREFDAQEPRKPHGMGVQFLLVDDATKPMLDRLVRSREGGRSRRRSAIPGQRNGDVLADPGGSQGRIEIRSSRSMSAVPDDDGVSEQSIARAFDYARAVGARTISADGDNDLESLLADSAPADRRSPTVTEALDGLAEFLRPRSKSGLYRIPPELLNDKPGNGGK